MKCQNRRVVKSVGRTVALLACLGVGTAAFGAAVYDDASEPGVLRVSVDIGGATLDAARVTDGITNIVKTGVGDLTSVELADYTGDITINEGRYLVAQRGGLGADNVGTVYINDGASLCDASTYTDWGRGVAIGKTFVFSGLPATAESAYKLARTVYGTTGIGDASTFRFLDDATIGIDNQRLKLGNLLDLGGKTITFLNEKSWTMVEVDAMVTNGGQVVVAHAPGWANREATKLLNANGVFGFVASENPCSLTLSNACFEIVRPLSVASAALNLHNARFYTVTDSQKSDLTTFRWNGPVNISGDVSLADNESKLTSLTFAGPFCGEGTLKIGPGWVNLFAGEGDTFSGDVTVAGTTNGKIDSENSGIALRDSSPFFPKANTVTFTDGARLELEGDNHSELHGITFAGDVDTSITGGGAQIAGLVRPTMAGLTKRGESTLVMSNALHVTGTTAVEAGTLKLAPKVYGHAGLWEWKCVDMSKGDAAGQNAWGSPSDVLNPLWVDGKPYPPIMSTNQEDAVYSRLGAAKVFEGFDTVVSNGFRRATGYVYQGYVWNRSDEPKTWQFAFHQTYRGSLVVNGQWSPFGNPSEGSRTNIFETILQPGPNPILIYTLGASWNDRQDVSDRFDGLGLSYDPNPVAGETNVVNFVKLDDGGTGRLLTIDTDDSSAAAADLLPVFDTLAFASGAVCDLSGNAFAQGRLVGFPTVVDGDLAVTDSWAIAAEDVLAGAKMTVAGTLSFGEDATITSADGVKLTHHAAKEYIIATAAAVEGKPTIDKSCEALFDWKVETTETEVKLVYNPRGLLIKIR